MVVESGSNLEREILEKLYHFFHSKTDIRITRKNNESVVFIGKFFSFTKLYVCGKENINSNKWTDVDIADIADVVAA